MVARILEAISTCQRLLTDALPHLVAAQEQQALAHGRQSLAQDRQAAAIEALARAMERMLQQQQAFSASMLLFMALLFQRQQ